MKLAALLVAVLCAGCADREIRVTEYKGTATPGIAGAAYVDGQLDVNGCRVVQSDNPVDGCVRYKGAACSYSSAGCNEGKRSP